MEGAAVLGEAASAPSYDGLTFVSVSTPALAAAIKRRSASPSPPPPGEANDGSPPALLQPPKTQNPQNKKTQHMIAGAAAGIVEHTAMYPVDTIKTRMQALGHPGQQLQGSGRAGRLLAGGGGGASVVRALRAVLRREGVGGLYRGVGAVAWGAGPAHALYFAAYEAARDGLLALDPAVAGRAGAGGEPAAAAASSSHSPLAGHSGAYVTLATAAAGAAATLLNDAVMTPVDVVKQRLQVAHSPYCGVGDCVSRVVREEGPGALWRSYRTTVVMNVPFTAVHFSVYESAKRWLLGVGEEGEGGGGGAPAALREAKEAAAEAWAWLVGSGGVGGEQRQGQGTAAAAAAGAGEGGAAAASAPRREAGAAAAAGENKAEDEEPEEGLLVQLVAGGLAGGSAAAITTPLDVVKTRLQTEGVGAPRRYRTTAVLPVLRRIAREEGAGALWRGWKPRVMFHVPAAAVCWGTYETCKKVLA
jgi:solute carrier family 25 iron transporter 28/37